MDKAQRKFWDENGYLLLENVLTQDECVFIKDIVTQLANWERKKNVAHCYDHDPVYTGGHVSELNLNGSLQRVWNLINKHRVFQELIQRSIILETMEELFDRDTLHNKFTLSSLQANIIGPGGAEQRLHTDTPIPEPFPPWMIQANTVWLLDDFTENNGATWYLPGSHKFGTKPREHDQSRSDLVQLKGIKKGSVSIHSGYLWHKSGENRTDKDRIVLLGSFAASYVRDLSNEEEYIAVADDEILKNSSETLKKLIGVGHGVHRGALQHPPPSMKKQ